MLPRYIITAFPPEIRARGDGYFSSRRARITRAERASLTAVVKGTTKYDIHFAAKAHPEIPAQMARGEFATLHEWLRVNLYRHGRKLTPDELMQRATGGPMQIAPYIAYLRAKYGELYRLP